MKPFGQDKRDELLTRLTTMVAPLLPMVVVLGACSGGGSGEPTTATPAQVSGTVATGNPVANAAITATDTNGKTATAQADGNGHYTLLTSGLTAPVALVATDPTGQHSTLVSVLASLPAAGQSATANVNTLTTALTALLTPDGNSMDVVTAGSAAPLSSTVTSANVKNATATLDAHLANLLSATGLPANYDPIGTTYPTTAHTGADALVDMLSIVPEGAATYLVYNTSPGSSTATQSATFLTLNNRSAPSNVPVAPAVSSTYVANYTSLQNYLSTLPAALQPCAAAGGTGSACNGVIDAKYMDNGFTNITVYDSNLKSSTLSLNNSAPSAVYTNANGTSALVRIPYALSSGNGGLGQYTLYTTVQQTPAGTWDIIGNQLPYDLSVTTRTTYRQFLDTFTDTQTGNPDTNFFDAGLNLRVGSVKSGASGANISFANVTGPGLPGGVGCNPASTTQQNPCGVWLASYGSNPSTLDLVVNRPTAPLTAPPALSDVSGTNEFRWSWQPTTYRPPATAEYWSSTAVDVTQLPATSVYQFTLYDAKGNTLGTYSVTNSNSAADASLAQTYYKAGAFPVLGTGDYTTGDLAAGAQCPGTLSGMGSSDPAANFLCPTGSLAGQQSSVTVNFTPPPSTASITPPLTQTGAQIQVFDRVNCDVSTGISFGPAATSATISASGTCPTNGANEAFWAINNPTGDAAFRLVQIRSKTPNGVQFYLNQTYRNANNAPSAS